LTAHQSLLDLLEGIQVTKKGSKILFSRLMTFFFIPLFGVSASGVTAASQNLRGLRLAQAAAVADPSQILAAARLLYVHSRTGFVKSEVIESELRKRAEIQRSGLLITKDMEAADLIMEVRRSNFTTEYPYVVIDTKTKLIVASGKVNSLFGTAAGKIAKGFSKQLQQAHAAAAASSKK
jgi:hypothetical protein